jgi:hypothetical protein
MAILHPKVDKLEKDMRPQDYEITKFNLYLNSMPLEDKIEWHNQNVNVVENDLIQVTTNVRKLRM